MTAQKSDQSHLGHWVFPANKQRLPDGRWVITPGKPQLRVRTAEAVRITGIPSKKLHRLADAGLIRRAIVTSSIVLWWPAEIEALIERAAQDAGFARKICFRADLRPSDLRSSNSHPSAAAPASPPRTLRRPSAKPSRAFRQPLPVP